MPKHLHKNYQWWQKEWGGKWGGKGRVCWGTGLWFGLETILQIIPTPCAQHGIYETPIPRTDQLPGQLIEAINWQCSIGDATMVVVQKSMPTWLADLCIKGSAKSLLDGVSCWSQQLTSAQKQLLPILSPK